LSNLEIDINYKQDANTVISSYGTPQITKIYTDSDIAANGDGCTVMVDFKQQYYEFHSAGSQYQEEITGTVEVENIKGYALVNGLNTYADGSMVYGTNLLKNT
jgi:hypothetical protein